MRVVVGSQAVLLLSRSGLTQLGLADDVHLIVTADHGMTDVQPQRTVFLEDYLDVSQVRFFCCFVCVLTPTLGAVHDQLGCVGWPRYFSHPLHLQVDVITESPVLGINPRAPLNASFVVQALQGKHPDLHVWLKVGVCVRVILWPGFTPRVCCLVFVCQEDVPERFKYRNNRRVPAVVGLANLGWTIAKCVGLQRACVYAAFCCQLAACTYDRQRAGNTWWGYGMHGYDNEEANMHSIFLAR